MKKTKFALASEELISRCKAVILSNFGTKNPELLAEDFKFVFPVVGPLEKTEFVTIFSSFKLTSAFPDSVANYFGFMVCTMHSYFILFLFSLSVCLGGSHRAQSCMVPV